MKWLIFIIGLLALSATFAFADAGGDIVSGVTEGVNSASKKGFGLVSIVAKSIGILFVLICLLGAFFSSTIKNQIKDHIMGVVIAVVFLSIVIAVSEYFK